METTRTNSNEGASVVCLSDKMQYILAAIPRIKTHRNRFPSNNNCVKVLELEGSRFRIMVENREIVLIQENYKDIEHFRMPAIVARMKQCFNHFIPYLNAGSYVFDVAPIVANRFLIFDILVKNSELLVQTLWSARISTLQSLKWESETVDIVNNTPDEKFDNFFKGVKLIRALNEFYELSEEYLILPNTHGCYAIVGDGFHKKTNKLSLPFEEYTALKRVPEKIQKFLLQDKYKEPFLKSDDAEKLKLLNQIKDNHIERVFDREVEQVLMSTEENFSKLSSVPDYLIKYFCASVGAEYDKLNNDEAKLEFLNLSKAKYREAKIKEDKRNGGKKRRTGDKKHSNKTDADYGAEQDQDDMMTISSIRKMGNEWRVYIHLTSHDEVYLWAARDDRDSCRLSIFGVSRKTPEPSTPRAIVEKPDNLTWYDAKFEKNFDKVNYFEKLDMMECKRLDKFTGKLMTVVPIRRYSDSSFKEIDTLMVDELNINNHSHELAVFTDHEILDELYKRLLYHNTIKNCSECEEYITVVTRIAAFISETAKKRKLANAEKSALSKRQKLHQQNLETCLNDSE